MLDKVELSIDFKEDNLKIAEIWVRVNGDNVKGLIGFFDARNKNLKSGSFLQDLITQVNRMPDINDWIDGWILHSRNDCNH